MGFYHRAGGFHGLEDEGNFRGVHGGDVAPTARCADFAMHGDFMVAQHLLDTNHMCVVDARLEHILALAPFHISQGTQGSFDRVFVRHVFLALRKGPIVWASIANNQPRDGSMNQRSNIAIIGGGPSGLMAAEVLATAGHAVTVYDRMPSLGRKFLLAGRGGLNLTHSEKLELFLSRYGAAADWLAPSIRAFPPDAVRAWCEGLGQETFVGSSGRVFPRSMKAAPLLRAWLQRLDKLGVQFVARRTWRGWQGRVMRFVDGQDFPVFVEADATLLALGGASWPRLGSDGGWVSILEQYGVPITPLRPANCGFIGPWSEHFSARFAGMPLKPVTLTHHGVSQQGEVMITAQGIEGGAVYALSAALRESIAAQGMAQLQLDLRPGMAVDVLAQKLEGRRGNKSLSTYLRKAGFSPLAAGLLRETIAPDQLAHATAPMLAAWLKAIPVILTAPTGLARAISTAGGIPHEAVTEGFMLRNRPGIFVAGEMLDWEAPTGGYLLQACFSTAVAAAHGITQFLAQRA